jgi:ornithine cyclodeaminase/alanine dehydrogenase-like protein (mu-crystallin family)
MDRSTLILTRNDVRRLLSLADCIDAVEAAFRRQGERLDPAPRVLGLHVDGGGFHAKAAVVGDYFACKLNGNFPSNRERHGLPTIQGVIVLSRTADGRVLAVMDSIEITILRTAAATAVAARALARADASTVTISGCGTQGAIHLQAIMETRKIRRAFLHDVDPGAARKLAEQVHWAPGIVVEPTSELRDAVRQSDVVVTCTPSRAPLFAAADVRPGTFVAAVGADSEDKQELEPALLARATVVVDSLDQCATIGELHHALAAGVMTRDAVHADLGQLAAGRRPGRRTTDEIIVFDSTGTALQDVAAAALVHERARAAGVGSAMEMAS